MCCSKSAPGCTSRTPISSSSAPLAPFLARGAPRRIGARNGIGLISAKSDNHCHNPPGNCVPDAEQAVLPVAKDLKPGMGDVLPEKNRLQSGIPPLLPEGKSDPTPNPGLLPGEKAASSSPASLLPAGCATKRCKAAVLPGANKKSTPLTSYLPRAKRLLSRTGPDLSRAKDLPSPTCGSSPRAKDLPSPPSLSARQAHDAVVAKLPETRPGIPPATSALYHRGTRKWPRSAPPVGPRAAHEHRSCY